MNERGVLKFISIASLTVISLIISCSKDETPDPGPPVTETGIGEAEIWTTAGDKSKLLSKGTNVAIYELGESSYPTITIDTTERLQEIEGFGAALTGSSAYVIHEMSGTPRTSLLKDLFDPETGIGITYVRMTIGASDFSLSDYSYDDMPSGQTDEDLGEFSLSHDEEDVIPMFKEILDIAPDLKIMGSPWSPPAWMKTNGSMIGGKLKEEYYDVYAQYFVKYIQTYADEGITIDAITPQNEPLYSDGSYPCMEMLATEQANFIKNNLGPEFQSAGIDTKIIVYDHNFDHSDYPTSILNDADANQYVAGSAFHAYNDLDKHNASVMTTLHNVHPDKGLYFTEMSGGDWATNFSDNLIWNMQNLFIGTTKNWSRNTLLWNLALDPNNGPKNNGCSNCRGVVTVNGSTVTRNEEYYSIGHFSKFIRYGAHRVEQTDFASDTGLISVAFMNEDGSKVLVVANTGDSAKNFCVQQGHRQLTTQITAKTVVTLRWE